MHAAFAVNVVDLDLFADLVVPFDRRFRTFAPSVMCRQSIHSKRSWMMFSQTTEEYNDLGRFCLHDLNAQEGDVVTCVSYLIDRLNLGNDFHIWQFGCMVGLKCLPSICKYHLDGVQIFLTNFYTFCAIFLAALSVGCEGQIYFWGKSLIYIYFN